MSAHTERFTGIFFALLVLLQGCATVPPAQETPPPLPTEKVTPAGVYAVNGQYIWDSWLLADSDERGKFLHRYALSAPSRDYTPNERHLHAFVRHAVSRNGGVTWKDLGPAITPSGEKGVWPDRCVWTSSILLREVKGQKLYLMFITGLNSQTPDGKPNDGLIQQIGLATSRNGHTFDQPRVILSPDDSKAAELGYDISADDGIVMAWRDPFVFQDPPSGTWHMLFSAKTKDACGTVHPTVGHAVARDDTLRNWELQAPLALPQYYRQLEVPYLIHRENRYYLFVSTQNNPTMHNNRDKEAAFRGFVADAPAGPWSLLYRYDQDQQTDKIYGHQIYAPTIFKRASGEYGAVTFFSLDTGCPLTGTPIVAIEWAGDTPLFRFARDLGCCIRCDCLRPEPAPQPTTPAPATAPATAPTDAATTESASAPSPAERP